MRQIHARVVLLTIMLVMVLAWCPQAKIQAAARSPSSYPPDPTANMADWSPASSTVAEVQSAFNAARAAENMQLGKSIPMLALPAQATWNAMDNNARALWLINRERIDRGVMPLHGTETNVIGVAQAYAQYLLANDWFDHTDKQGNDPWDRMNANQVIGACHDFLGVGENLSVGVTSGSSIALPLEQAIYSWMYVDSGSAWGHRHATCGIPTTTTVGRAAQKASWASAAPVAVRIKGHLTIRGLTPRSSS